LPVDLLLQKMSAYRDFDWYSKIGSSLRLDTRCPFVGAALEFATTSSAAPFSFPSALSAIQLNHSEIALFNGLSVHKGLHFLVGPVLDELHVGFNGRQLCSRQRPLLSGIKQFDPLGRLPLAPFDDELSRRKPYPVVGAVVHQLLDHVQCFKRLGPASLDQLDFFGSALGAPPRISRGTFAERPSSRKIFADLWRSDDGYGPWQ
jgi:hypothetical protein